MKDEARRLAPGLFCQHREYLSYLPVRIDRSNLSELTVDKRPRVWYNVSIIGWFGGHQLNGGSKK